MLDIVISKDPVQAWKGDALLVLLGEEDCRAPAVSAPCIDAPYGERVKELLERKDFMGKKGSLVKVPLFGENVKNLYLAGLGKMDAASDPSAALRDSLTAALRKIGRERNESVRILSGKLPSEAGVIVGEAAEFCGYTFDKYKKKEEDEPGFALKTICVSDLEQEGIDRGRLLASAQCYSRNIANEPGNVVNPASLAALAESLAKEKGLFCEVWDEKRLERENMGAILAVGQGSDNPPRLIHLTYKPQSGNTPAKKVVFVGKGITFDSGGLDLKPSNFMTTMKGDKSGACNVLGIMKGVAEMAPGVEVHGILAVAENMPSGSAFRPDDVIRARNGKTIEIDNTDAEGRLVLADALCLAAELNPDVLIDIATLTGACAVALGSWTAGLFTMDDALSETLTAVFRSRGDRLWRLPMDDEKIGETKKSPIADLVNSGNRYGGATFAAIFLSEFVEKGIAWAHLDIAGVDFYKEEWGIYSKGASAWGVRSCLDYIDQLQK